jgi:hypothetical protein
MKPAAYSERFVKRRGLFCLALAQHQGANEVLRKPAGQ